MISVQEALNIILQNTLHLPDVSVSLSESLGKYLQEDIIADRDFPPFDRVTMDGIAINYQSFQEGQRTFKVEGQHFAGSPNVALNDPTNCLEVMTGAILPKGTDTVIRYEDINIEDGSAQITIEAVKANQNVHGKGTDRKTNDLLITKGHRITPSEIGVMATVGKYLVKTNAQPKIAIISTGDELVDINTIPEPYQIRKSNVYNIQSAIQSDYSVNADLFHIADNKSETIRKIEEVANQYQVLILSGGVSKGKADYVPEALEALGYKKLLHRIQQRPGKPFWFGAKEKSHVVFAFPGNPVSTFLCYQKYFKPWMTSSAGGTPKEPLFAALGSDFSFKPNLTYFLQVALQSEKDGRLVAQPIEGHGSGDLANLVKTNAFIELPMGRDHFSKDEVFEIIPF